MGIHTRVAESRVAESRFIVWLLRQRWLSRSIILEPWRTSAAARASSAEGSTPLRSGTTLAPMSLGRRKRDRQPTMWVPTTELPIAASQSARNCSSTRVRICARPAGCGGRTCADTRTCLSDCSYTPAHSNLGLWMRSLFGIGTPRALQGRLAGLATIFSALWSLMDDAIRPRLASEFPSGAIGTIGERIDGVCVKAALVPRAARATAARRASPDTSDP